jgi:hypothetical protein
MGRPTPGPHRIQRTLPGAYPWPAELARQQPAANRALRAVHPHPVVAMSGPGRARVASAPLAPNRQPRQLPNPIPPHRPPHPATFYPGPTPHHNYPLQGENAFGATVFANQHRSAPPRRKHSWLLYGGALTTVVVAVILIVGFASPGIFLVRKLDITQAQAGVERILSDPAGYGARHVSNVTCNDGHSPIIHKGETFTCEATIDRVRQVFVVTFIDDAGSYQVGRPQQATAT